MALKLLTPPTASVLTLAEAKVHLREDLADAGNDALITAIITAATQDAEHLMGRAILPQTWQLTLDAFPSVIDLPRPTVTAVASVKYVDAATGTLTTLSPSLYQACLASEIAASVVPAYGCSWPVVRVQPESVQVTYTSGWATPADVPELVKAWIKLRIGALYETRQSWTMGQREAIQPNPFIDFMLDRYRVWTM